MAKKIRIKSGRDSKFSTNFTVKGINYHVQTEEPSAKNPNIISTSYMGGIIVEKMKSPYPYKDEIKKEELHEIMTRHHKLMIDKVIRKHIESTKTKAEYIKDARKFIKRRKLDNALEMIEDAKVLFPDDPFILSLHGYLRAAVLKQHKEGIDECKTALSLYNKKKLLGGEYYLHFFYLNLGRVFLLSENKDVGIMYLRKGLEYDISSNELINELIRLGLRKNPVISFLPRDSFLNKYLGKLLSGFGIR